jgi:3-oxoacyl-[acyl-carrier protein] reductase
MERDLDGRVALITGASRGIGRAIALGLAGDGAAIVVNYRRDESAARAVVAEIEERGGTACSIQADVGVRADVTRLVAEARAALGAIDLLVCNAGVASRGSSVVDSDLEEFDRVLAVHALGAVQLCQLVLPDLRAAARGDVVFISSVLTARNDPNGAPYNMGKAAEEALAQTLAREERQHGVHVNIVAPGLVDTDMGDRLVRATTGAGRVADLAERSPFGRVCSPADIAGAVRFLVSPAAGYVTGQRIGVDGGDF